jgi:hypothetical protein
MKQIGCRGRVIRGGTLNGVLFQDAGENIAVCGWAAIIVDHRWSRDCCSCHRQSLGVGNCLVESYSCSRDIDDPGTDEWNTLLVDGERNIRCGNISALHECRGYRR